MKVLVKLVAIAMAVGCASPVLPQEQTSSNSGSGRSSRSRSSRSSSNGETGGTGTGETASSRERRRESRSQDRERNSRSSRRSETTGANGAAATPAAGQAKPGETGKDSKTVAGAKPAASKGSGSGGPKPVDIKFEMQADPETNIMYLEAMGDLPSLNVSATENKKFVTRLALYNPKSSIYSQLDASIKYDPQLIRPVGVDDSSMKSNLASPARVLVDKARGLLSIAVDFQEPRTDSFMTFAKIQWEALEPVASTPIRFVNTRNHPSGVFNEAGDNILHIRSDGTVEMSANAGLLDASVSIEPTSGTVKLVEASGNAFSALSLATNINSGTAEGGIELSLRPRASAVAVGNEFLVDVMYRNPRNADVDTVKLKLRFDPQVLEVVDQDAGNWITRGINIFDGDYHDDLPFDYHRKNSAHNDTGIILYENGFGSRVNVPEEGVLATIRFRAKVATPSTSIAFSTGDESAIEQDTAISFLGFNLIGKPGQRVTALNNTSVGVHR